MRVSWVVFAAVLLATGCNTLENKTFQKIYVRTPGVTNAACDVYTPDNRYFVLTPREVMVERRKHPLTIVCKKEGYYPASAIVKSEMVYSEKAVIGNAFTGIVPGFLYDAASNSVHDYPDTIVITMEAIPSHEQEAPKAADPLPGYVMEMKPEEVKPVPLSTAPSGNESDKALSKSLRK